MDRSRPTLPVTTSVSLRNGYSMIANQFSRGNNTLAEVLPAVPEGSLLFKFDAKRQTWGSVCQFRFNLWDQPTVTLAPGEGCIFRNPRADFCVILAGVVWPNTSNPPLVRGLNIISIPVPEVDPDPILSATGTAYFLQSASTNSNDYFYTPITHMGGFVPEIRLNIGESFWEASDSAPSSTNVAPSAGIVYLNNYVPAAGINAPFFGIAGCLLQDTNWLAELLAGPDVLSLAPVGDQLSFLTGVGAGYLDTSRGAVRYIPTVQPGAPVFCQVRVWDSSDGATTYAAATRKLKSNAFQVTTGGSGTPPSLPAYLVGLMSFSGIAPREICSHPTDQIAFLGGAARFSVVVAGPPDTTFRWQRLENETNWVDIPGATSPDLIINPVSLSDAGMYRIGVIYMGTLFSKAARLTVLEGLHLQSLALNSSDGSLTFTLRGKAGFNYAVEISTNLTDWTAWKTFTNFPGPTNITDATAPSGSQRYYRAKEVSE